MKQKSILLIISIISIVSLFPSLEAVKQNAQAAPTVTSYQIYEFDGAQFTGFSTVYYNIDTNGQYFNEADSQIPQSHLGTSTTLKINILQNGLTGNLVLTIRDNGVNIGSSCTILPTDIGLKTCTFNANFNQNDLLDIKGSGDGNTGPFVSGNGQIEIKYTI